MARTIEFDVGGTVVSAELNKVDRDKLYGSVSIDTRSIDGGRCSLATLASDGRTLVPHGGTSLGYLNRDGEWVQRSDLTAVSLAGEELEQVESSFNAPVPVEATATLDEFLDHGIRLVYLLGGVGDFDPAFGDALADGTIYKVEFSYRGGVAADPAFLLADHDDAIWFLIGNAHEVEFVGLAQASVCANVDADEHPDDEEGGDPLDFGML